MPIVIDGVDDTATAMNRSGLPQQALYMAQALAIFPAFLRGVYLGYEGLGEEAAATLKEFHHASFNKAQLLAKISELSQELCEICDLDYEIWQNRKPDNFIKELSKAFNRADETQRNNIIALTERYQKEVEEELEAPKASDVIAGYFGWTAMISMMTSVAAYEFQAVAIVCGGIKGITKSVNPDKLPLISQIGSHLGLVGQRLMVLYASHKTVNEYQEWSAISKELEQFGQAKNKQKMFRI